MLLLLSWKASPHAPSTVYCIVYIYYTLLSPHLPFFITPPPPTPLPSVLTHCLPMAGGLVVFLSPNCLPQLSAALPTSGWCQTNSQYKKRIILYTFLFLKNLYEFSRVDFILYFNARQFYRNKNSSQKILIVDPDYNGTVEELHQSCSRCSHSFICALYLRAVHTPKS